MAYKIMCVDGRPSGEFGHTVFSTRERAEEAINDMIDDDIIERGTNDVFFNIDNAYALYRVVEI